MTTATRNIDLEDVLNHVERYAKVIDEAATRALDALAAKDADAGESACITIDLAAQALRDLVQRVRNGGSP